MQKRLDKLQEYLALLREIGKNSKDDYVNNPFIHGNGERYLHNELPWLESYIEAVEKFL